MTKHNFDTETFEQRRDRILAQCEALEWDFKIRMARKERSGVRLRPLQGRNLDQDDIETVVGT